MRQRRPTRLKEYDYSQAGYYSVTVSVDNRICLFGEIIDGQMQLNECGKIVDKCWNEIPIHFPHVVLDEYIIMPNHIHGIINITHCVGAKNLSPLQMAKNHSPVQMANNHSPLQISVIPSTSQISETSSIQPTQRPHGTSKTIGSIIRGFKIGVTKWVRQNTDIKNVWQRNYYEHVIRNDIELGKIRKYIHENSLNWETDSENTKQCGNQKS